MRTFPVLYASDVARAAAFWQRLGFERRYSFPDGDAPGYVSLRRDGCDVALTSAEWPATEYDLDMGGCKVEMFVYVADVDALVRDLRTEGVRVLRDPAEMPWGERIATIQDPDGNPVSLANEGPSDSM